MHETIDNNQHWMVLVLILRKIAESKGITQQEIADKTGLKKPNVSRMFALQQCPTLRTFILVARAIKVDFFFKDKEAKTDLTHIFEAAMADLGRRPDKLPKN